MDPTRRAFLSGGTSLALILGAGLHRGRAATRRPTVVVFRDPT